LDGTADCLAASGSDLHRCVQGHADATSLSSPFQYQNTRGDSLEQLPGPILAHVFNHGTHHRGQVSAALTQLGQREPKLDLLYFLDDAA